MTESVFGDCKLAQGTTDQYSDGTVANSYDIFVRANNHSKNFLIPFLKEKGCKRILDVSCGTGVDSINLLEAGFDVTSTDASDQMLKKAYKTRWARRKEPSFDNWVIHEANWLTLTEDIDHLIGEGFDAVICLGNSFPHLPDEVGDHGIHKKALKNFDKFLKPGGFFLVDHRNYDYILDNGKQPPINSEYYKYKSKTDISVLHLNGKPVRVVLDYSYDTTGIVRKATDKSDPIIHFRLSFYPHRVQNFKAMVKEVFDVTDYKIFGDFKKEGEVQDPAFYMHVLEKAANKIEK